jgi:hypothetical protein
MWHIKEALYKHNLLNIFPYFVSYINNLTYKIINKTINSYSLQVYTHLRLRSFLFDF